MHAKYMKQGEPTHAPSNVRLWLRLAKCSWCKQRCPVLPLIRNELAAILHVTPSDLVIASRPGESRVVDSNNGREARRSMIEEHTDVFVTSSKKQGDGKGKEHKLEGFDVVQKAAILVERIQTGEIHFLAGVGLVGGQFEVPEDDPCRHSLRAIDEDLDCSTCQSNSCAYKSGDNRRHSGVWHDDEDYKYSDDAYFYASDEEYEDSDEQDEEDEGREKEHEEQRTQLQQRQLEEYRLFAAEAFAAKASLTVTKDAPSKGYVTSREQKDPSFQVRQVVITTRTIMSSYHDSTCTRRRRYYYYVEDDDWEPWDRYRDEDEQREDTQEVRANR